MYYSLSCGQLWYKCELTEYIKHQISYFLVSGEISLVPGEVVLASLWIRKTQ